MTPHEQMWVNHMALVAERVREVRALPLSQPVSLPVDGASFLQFTDEMTDELRDKYNVRLACHD